MNPTGPSLVVLSLVLSLSRLSVVNSQEEADSNSTVLMETEEAPLHWSHIISYALHSPPPHAWLFLLKMLSVDDTHSLAGTVGDLKKGLNEDTLSFRFQRLLRAF